MIDSPAQTARMRDEKSRVARTSVAAALLLTGSKLAVGLWTGSLGILSEAAHSGLDLLAALITLFAVRIADKPPDKNHQYGHGKVENLSALVEALLLVLTSLWILYEAYERLFFETPSIDVNAWSFSVIIVSIIIDYSRSKALYRVARKYNSQALEADALHFRTDIWSSTVVLFGLVTVLLGTLQADSIAASIVAIIVLATSVRLGKRTIDILLDRVPRGIEEQIIRIVRSVEGVDAVRWTRIRQAGAYTFADIVIGIRRSASFDEAHAIMTHVERSLQAEIPRCEVIVHAEPIIGSEERLSESISWIVNQYKMIPHNVTILRLEEQIHVDLDIEFPHGTSFIDAHALAEQIENRLKKNIPRISEVSIHLEEEMSWYGHSHDASGDEVELIAAVHDIVSARAGIRRIGQVKVYEGERGLKVNIVCTLDANMTLGEVHDIVNGVETDVSRLDQRIKKVFVHAEPANPYSPLSGPAQRSV